MLAKDEPLPRRCFDHALSGEWSDHRDCHIRPDLILIYRKPDETSLELVRLGSHSELGLWETQSGARGTDPAQLFALANSSAARSRRRHRRSRCPRERPWDRRTPWRRHRDGLPDFLRPGRIDIRRQQQDREAHRAAPACSHAGRLGDLANMRQRARTPRPDAFRAR